MRFLLRRSLPIVAHATLAGLVLVVLLRLLRIEVHALTVGLIAAAPQLMMFAWPVGLWFVVRRQWRRAMVAGLLVVAQLALVVGSIGWRALPEVPPAGDLRIGTANVYANNGSAADVLAGFLIAGVDVAVLQEVTPEILVSMSTTVAWDQYPHRVLDSRPGFFGSAILSKYPLDGDVLWVDEWPMTEATITTDAGPVHIVNVHIEPPLSAEGVRRWKQQASELASLAESHVGPIVLAGDFNATDQHSTISQLQGVGLTDAHWAAGSGLGSTWPNIGPIRPFLRIDRLLSSDGLTPIDTRRLGRFGSDHRPVVVTYVLGAPSSS